MEPENEVASQIMAMEGAALERWGKGDPGGFLEICAPVVVYCDPYRERRMDVLEALAALPHPLGTGPH